MNLITNSYSDLVEVRGNGNDISIYKKIPSNSSSNVPTSPSRNITISKESKIIGEVRAVLEELSDQTDIEAGTINSLYKKKYNKTLEYTVTSVSL